MKNKEKIEYICDRLRKKFEYVHVEDTNYFNEQSSSFYVKFDIGEVVIIFVKDRGCLEVEILKNGKFTLIENLNKAFADLKFSNENIDKVIEFLSLRLIPQTRDNEEE